MGGKLGGERGEKQVKMDAYRDRKMSEKGGQ